LTVSQLARRATGARCRGVDARGVVPISGRDDSRNPAACARLGGADVQEDGTRVWGPPVALSGTLRRVARAAEDGAVADVDRRAASRERHDVIDGQVGGAVGRALVSRAPVAMLATPGAEHAGAETLPGPRAVQGVVTAAVGLAGVLSAAATRAAGDDTTDPADLHRPNRRWPGSVRSIRSRCYACATMAAGGAGFARLLGDGRRPEPQREGFGPLVAGAKQPIVVQQGLWSSAADQLGSPLRREREVSFGEC
jgi:hypothetical protein